MSEIGVDLGDRSYVVIVEPGAIARLGERIARIANASRVIVVTNPVIGRLYGDRVEKSLSDAGLKVSRITIPAGERFKTLRTLECYHNRVQAVSAVHWLHSAAVT